MAQIAKDFGISEGSLSNWLKQADVEDGRPMFHHEADSIHAHLTIVFTALAISRHLQEATGYSIRKIIRTLRPLRDVTISIGGNEITATTPPSPHAADILVAIAGH